MPYIWENYSNENEYQIGDKVCPYIEVLNNYSKTIDVNPLLRFETVFNAVVSNDQIDLYAFDALYEQIGGDGTKQVVNVLFHYLAQLDRNRGLDSTQQVIEKLREEIEYGLWGNKVQSIFKALTDSDKECILYILSNRLQNDNQSCFMDSVGKAFPFSSLCYEEKTKAYYLYIGAEENIYNTNKLEVIKILFWTVNRNLKIVWNYHYGIVGCDDTMHIDYIQIV